MHDMVKGWRFNLPKHVPPVPDYSDAGEAVFLMPFIGWNAPEMQERQEAYSLCTAWARRSWYLFTDAAQCGVRLKIYAAMNVAELAHRYLPLYGIDMERDVLFFNDEPYEGPSHFSKKLAFTADPQLSEYKWVFQADADCFFARRNMKTGRYKFFRRWLDRQTEHHHIGAVAVCLIDYSVEQRSWHYEHRVRNEAGEHVYLPEKFYQAVEALGVPAVESEFRCGTNRVWCHNGGLYAYPARHYHTPEKAPEITWLRMAANLLGNDEACLAMYAHKFGKLLEIDKLTALHLFCYDYETSVTLEQPNAASPVMPAGFECGFFIYHPFGINNEPQFRRDIGVHIV